MLSRKILPFLTLDGTLQGDQKRKKKKTLDFVIFSSTFQPEAWPAVIFLSVSQKKEKGYQENNFLSNGQKRIIASFGHVFNVDAVG